MNAPTYSTCRNCRHVQPIPVEIEWEPLQRCEDCGAYDWDPEPIKQERVCLVAVSPDSPLADLIPRGGSRG